MQNKRRYPPSQIQYQLEHPPVTVHLTQRLKDNLEKLKKNRSYGEVINGVIEGTFNIEREIKTLPKSEAMIQYSRGFREATNKFAAIGECSKCHRKLALWKDGKCIISSSGYVSYYSNFTLNSGNAMNLTINLNQIFNPISEFRFSIL